MRGVLDALVFSSVWVGSAAGALCGSVALATGAGSMGSLILLAASGTIAVYNIDRLRDLSRDRATAPLRSAFVERHLSRLRVLAFGSGLVAAGLAVRLGAPSVALLAPVLAIGLFHRRLKRFAWVKSGYITAAWLTVVVGLPTLLGGDRLLAGWALAVIAPALLANAIASNVRDREAAVPRLGVKRALGVARVVAALGVSTVFLVPEGLGSLAFVPAATLLALIAFRESERYGMLILDGALLVGALVSFV